MREPGRADQLHDGRVQRVGGVHRGRAALDVVHLRPLVRDDQRPLELAHVLRVDAEVGLQRHVHLHAGRHVDEGAARPHGRVQGGELVVVRGDELAEPLAHQFRVVAHGGVHVAEVDALGLEVLAVAVEDDLRLVLSGHPGQVLALGLGDPELLVRALDGVGQVFPLVHLAAGGLDVIEDVVEVQIRHLRGEPRCHRLALEVLEGAQPEVPHPVRLALHLGHLAHDGLVQALLGLEDVVLLVAPSELIATEIEIRCDHGAPEIAPMGRDGGISPM